MTSRSPRSPLSRSHILPPRFSRPRSREPGMIDLPERFKDVADESDTEEEGDDARDPELPFMHQSVFGVIAAAQSKEDFGHALDDGSEEDISGDETVHTGGKAPERPGVVQGKDVTPEPAPRQKKRLSQRGLLKSLPGLKSRKASATEPEASKTPSVPPSPDPVHERPGFRDAPIMSQMLHARANAESLESSSATITARQAASVSASTSSLRSTRKAPVALPDALKDIFKFDQAEEVISEYPCWYLANVLLQGYLYITQKHVCFYAYLQQKSNTNIKSGHLAKRGKTNPHFRRYWFALKETVLSYYNDPAAPYFPSGNIDLRYGISAELIKHKEKGKETTFFSVTTDKRTYQFKADSPTSAKEWVKQLQKVIFRSHNDGDSVKISLPIDNILDIEENPVIDFAETIKIRVIDNDETFAVDEYFFSFFSFGKDALNVLKIMTQDTLASKALARQGQTTEEHAVVSPKLEPERSGRPSMTLEVPDIHENVRATLVAVPSPVSSPRISGERSRTSLDVHSRHSLVDRPRESFDRSPRSVSAASRVRFDNARPRSMSPLPRDTRTSASRVSPVPQRVKSPDRQADIDSTPGSSSRSEQLSDETTSDASGSRILSGSGVFRDPALAASAARRKVEPPRLLSPDESTKTSAASSRSASPGAQGARHAATFPMAHEGHEQTSAMAINPNKTSALEPRQSSSYTESLGGLMRAGTSYPIQKATDFAGLLRNHSRRMSSIIGSSPRGYYEKVYGMWAGGKKHYGDVDGLQSDDHVYDPDEDSDTAQAEARFRDYFAQPESEKLVATYFAHILRVLPLYGKIYIGSTKVCFRSLLPGTRTRLIIPLKDILNVDKEKGFRFGYSGMVVVIRGHEEIFFEFNAAGLRDDCTVTILKSLETMKHDPAEEEEARQREEENSKHALEENMLLQEARQEGQYAQHDVLLPRDIDEFDNDVPPIVFDDPQLSVVDFQPPEPLAITCLTIGSRGDVQPYIALCKGFLAQGHKPKIATHAEFEPWIRKHGIDFAPVDGDPAELMRICVENGMFTPSFLYEANSKFRGFLDTLLTTAWTACQGSDVLIESPSAMAGIHIAEALGIPYFRAFTMPWTRTRAYPHAFAVPNHKMGGAYNYMTYVLFDNIFWQSTAGQVNRWRRKVLHLRPTTLDRMQPNKVPFLYNFSPSVVVPPLDFSDWIRVTGYWFLDEATTWTPPQDLVDFIAKARADEVPLVYIGFGSVVVSDSRALTESIVKAVLKADVRCILSKGWSDRLSTKTSEPEVPLPPSIFPIASAPHDWLFAQIDAAVHHGGAGTTGASLRAGVPTIIRPFFGDQFFFGARVHDLGVGICVRKVSEQVLGKALWIATHDARMRDKARVLGEQIRNEDGVGNAIKAVYRDLEYARTLVERKRKRAGEKDEEVETGHELEHEHSEDEEGTDAIGRTGESWTLVEGDSEEEKRGVRHDTVPREKGALKAAPARDSLAR